MTGSRWGSASSLLLCLLLSLILHAILAMMLLTVDKTRPQRYGGTPPARTVVIQRRAPEPKPAAPDMPKKELDFAKTSADTPEQAPQQADYEGARNTRAMSDPTARERRSEEAAPAMNGRERVEDEEIVTFDQEAQVGDLEHEHKAQPAAEPAAASPEPQESAQPNDGDSPQELHASGSLTLNALPADPPGTQAKPAETNEEGEDAETEKAAKPHPRRPVYDPALAESAQSPGFRTRERRTRSSGSFVFGRGAALNVEATARGRYEAEIYRRVARIWYAACDDHRGDIIPGRITLSLRLNKKGQLVNMHLIGRRGASVSQQSFTFAAIRRAALPAMPGEVQAYVVGDLLELIFTFNFD